MVQTTVAESTSQSSVDTAKKGTLPENRHGRRRPDLRGKSLAEQDALLAPDEDQSKVGGKKSDAKGPHDARRDKGGPARKPAYPPDVQKVLERWPDGVAMSFYPDYEKGSKAYAHGEFVKQATSQAKAIGAVSLVGGKLVLGKTHAITDQATIIEQANAVSAYLASVLSPEDRAADRHKLAQLHIYGHGWGTGMSTNGHKQKGQKGNMSSGGIEKFVAAISGALRSDVNVALLACSTGKDMDKKSKTKDIDEVDDPADKKPQKGKKPRENGEGSFADKFRDELVEQGHKGANVGGHMTAGHMSGNPLGRYFTGEGAAATFFDTIFPQSWRIAEADKVGLSEEKFGKQLHKWFVKYTSFWRKGKLGKGKRAKKLPKGAEKLDMGYVMMVDPTQAKEIFRAAWDHAGGNFNDLSHVPEVDWSKLGVHGADSATEARTEGRGQLIDL